MYILRPLLLLIVPGLIFSAAMFLHLEITVPASWQPLLTLFPYLAVSAGLFLGWRFNRSRVIWAIALLFLIDRALILATPYAHEYLLQVAPLIVPLNLVLYGWQSERGLFTMHGLLRFCLFLLQVAGVVWLYFSNVGEVIAWLSRPLFAGVPSIAPLSQLALLVISLSMIALLVLFCKKPGAIEGGFCWTLLAVAAGFCWPDRFSFWSGVASFLLAISLVESSFKMAFNDELTDLPSRRAMNEFLLKVGRRYTVAMVDVDHFKKVNDIHGHDVGDQVLRMVATCLRRVTGSGRAFRYGGEEFAVIFPNKDLERTLPHLEELRETIGRAGFVVRGRKRPKQKPENTQRKSAGKGMLHVTVSIGVATRDDKNVTPVQLLKAADQALYKAKKGGRNQVCSA